MDFSFFTWKKSEAIFVVSVILVLFGISYFQLKIGQMKARDAQRKADVELVGRALDQYLLDNKILPPSQNGKIVACGNKGLDACAWGGGPIVDSQGVSYLKKIPQDPFAYQGRFYVYEADLIKNKYRISISLEYTSDISWKHDLTTWCGNGVQCNWYVQN